jgi:hypothetical protein
VQSAVPDNDIALFPSLFELQLSASLPQLSLKSAKTRFRNPLQLPPLPNGNWDPNVTQLPIFLQAAFDIEMEMLLTWVARNVMKSEDFNCMRTQLLDWVTASLDIITSPAMFTDSYVNKEPLAQLVRALGFARGLDLPTTPCPTIFTIDATRPLLRFHSTTTPVW